MSRIGVDFLSASVQAQSIWAVAFYASRLLREDMQAMLGEQQFSTVSGIAREIDSRLSDRKLALERIAKDVTPLVMANPVALQALIEQRSLLQLLFNGGVFVIPTDFKQRSPIAVSGRKAVTNFQNRPSCQRTFDVDLGKSIDFHNSACLT